MNYNVKARLFCGLETLETALEHHPFPRRARRRCTRRLPCAAAGGGWRRAGRVMPPLPPQPVAGPQHRTPFPPPSSFFPPLVALPQLALHWSLWENFSASIRSGDVLSAYLYLLTGDNAVVGYVQGANGILQARAGAAGAGFCSRDASELAHGGRRSAC